MSFFNKALSNFTHEVASAGAIRHLADKGYTVKQIHSMLDYPTPFERVQDTVWKYYIDKGIILLKNPDEYKEHSQYEYVKEQGQYGTTSFRLVKKEFILPFDEYVPCNFGKIKYQSEEKYQQLMNLLNSEQIEYISGLPWPLTTVYHCMNERMKAIWSKIG